MWVIALALLLIETCVPEPPVVMGENRHMNIYAHILFTNANLVVISKLRKVRK